MDIDELEEKHGGMSVYQFMCVFAAAWLMFSANMISQTGVFYNAVPEHRCDLQNLQNHSSNSSFISNKILSMAIPPGDSCHRYAYNSTECVIAEDLSCLTNQTDTTVIACDKGYYFDNTYFEETVITEWNLVCDQQIWVAILNSLYFVGCLVGSVPVGYMSDRFGRKFSMIVLGFGIILSGVTCAFSPSILVYCISRFFEGATSIPALGVVISYGNELSSKKLRTYIVAALAIFSNMSHTLLPGIAYFLRDWRSLNICLALLPVPFIFTIPFISETPRWLLVKGRISEAKKVVNRIAESKKQTLCEKDWELMIEVENEKMNAENQGSRLTDLFRLPFTRIVTIIVMFNWTAINCVYYGLVLNVATLSGDLFVNAVLNGATQIAASVPYLIILSKKGSRTALIFGTSFSGLLCIVAMIAGEFEDPAAQEIVRWASIFGKLFASISFFATYQYTNDVFPTVNRGGAMGLASTSARIGSIIIPFIVFAHLDAQWVVEAVFGILAISSASLTLLLPDTGALTTSLQEAENYYRANMKVVARYVGKASKNHQKVEHDNKGYLIEIDLPQVNRTEAMI